MDELEARELRYFVAVAEELHFGRAADRLGVAQPAVSRTIAGLEQRLGVCLLERTTRLVALTEPGGVLLTQARIALVSLAAARRLTLRASRQPHEVVVAVKPDGDAGLLEPAIAVYDLEADAASIRPLLVSPSELTASLADGRADVAIIPHPFNADGLESEELLSEPRLAALPTDHPLAAEEQLSLQDFDTLPVARWAGVDPALDAYYRGLDGVGRAARHDGGPIVHDLAEALRLVELGRAVTFLAESIASRFENRRIAWVPVTDLAPSHVTLAWRHTGRSPAAAAFARAIHRAAVGAR